MTKQGDAIVLDRPHPMAERLMEHYDSVRKERSSADRLAHQLYKDVTGIDLPSLVTWTDPEGNLWSLHADVRLTKIRQGGEIDG